jgi:DNA-binding MarR family transcriptional regulator
MTAAVRRAEECFAELLVALNRTAPGRWQELGITPQQVRLLLELSAAGTLRPMQLAQRMEIHVSTLSGITDRLAERGLVSRTPALDDRRCSDLALTDGGRRLLHDLFASGCGALHDALTGLGRRRLGQLEGLLVALTVGVQAGSTGSASVDG